MATIRYFCCSMSRLMAGYDQNLIVDLKVSRKSLDAMDPSNTIIFPTKIDVAVRKTQSVIGSHSPFGILARIGIPNYSKAFQTLAHNQTMVNEAQTACALERYRLANGKLSGNARHALATIHGKNPARHHRRTAIALSSHGRWTISALFGWLE